MDEPLSTEPYKGVRDFYPNDWSRLQAIFSCIRSTLVAWGYEEYNASPLERAELYEAKTSEEIVGEQTYTFTDRGDRRVTLRPEMTPTLARMVAAKRRELPLPLRWFSIGNRFRYERPQKGRLREFYQVDVDLVALAEGEADIEIVQLASEILKSFGAKDSDFVIRLNSRWLLNAACSAAGLTGEGIRRYLRLLDKKSKMAPEEFVSAAQALTEKDPLTLIANPKQEPEVAKYKKQILDMIDVLEGRGIKSVAFDPSITRGFDYYTGIVFEVYDTNPENPRALFGGGRYDELIKLFGGEPVQAVGFAVGEVTLSDFLETHGLVLGTNSDKAQLYLGTPSESDIPAAQAFAEILRKGGTRVFVNLSGRSLGDQVKDALKRSIPFFVAYGPEEVSKQTVRLKILATSEEVGVPTSELSTRILNAK